MLTGALPCHAGAKKVPKLRDFFCFFKLRREELVPSPNAVVFHLRRVRLVSLGCLDSRNREHILAVCKVLLYRKRVTRCNAVAVALNVCILLSSLVLERVNIGI